jgi:hypothetical protein
VINAWPISLPDRLNVNYFKMEQKIVLNALFDRYSPVLIRYAGMLVKNRLMGLLITEEVISRCKEENFADSSNLRAYLHQSTKSCCQQWLSMKDKTLYLRKPKNPT